MGSAPSARRYGDSGPCVILLHGGPGAPGYLAPLARDLADGIRVIEPFQRASGGEPLAVTRHVADLEELIRSTCAAECPQLVGHSWGAMLALAFAAAHPAAAISLVLIGCGTFDTAARERLIATRRARMDDDLKARLARIEARPDLDSRLKSLGQFYQRLDSVDLIKHADESLPFDSRAHDETWSDMIRLQQNGTYPAAFAAIQSPVLMLHGRDDPHPGVMIHDSLAPYVSQMIYREFTDCGHYPWLEHNAREEFLSVLRAWLNAHARDEGST